MFYLETYNKNNNNEILTGTVEPTINLDTEHIIVNENNLEIIDYMELNYINNASQTNQFISNIEEDDEEEEVDFDIYNKNNKKQIVSIVNIDDDEEEVDFNFYGDNELIHKKLASEQDNLITNKQNEEISNILGEVDIPLSVDNTNSLYLSNIKDTNNGTSIILSPLESVKYSIATYVQSEESDLVIERYNMVQHLIQIAKNEISDGEKVTHALHDFLLSDECKAIPNLTHPFVSNKYGTKGNFHTHIISSFINLKQINSTSTESLDYSTVWEEILDIIKEEKFKFSEQKLNDMYLALSKFSNFFDAMYNTFRNKGKTPDPIDILEYIDVLPPALITGDGYLCECGEFVATDIPPLALLLVKKQARYNYTLINNPVQCKACNKLLTIPEVIVNVLEPLIADIVKDYEVSLRYYAIYRPPLNKINIVIPSNLKYLFDLENLENDIPQSNVLERNISEYYSNYVNLVNYLMKKEHSRIYVKQSEQILNEMQSIPKIRDIGSVFDTLNIPLNISSDIYNYSKTLIHYLDTLGCFAITNNSAAFYKYCNISNIDKKCFDDDYSISWMYENAWVLSGLKPVTSGSIETNLDIRTEYIPVLNYIYILRTLAISDETYKDSKYHSWLNNPSSSTAFDFIKGLKRNRKRDDLSFIALSKRDFFDPIVNYSADAYRDLYSLIDEILDNESNNPKFDHFCQISKVYVEEVYMKSREDFYGDISNTNTLIKPTMRFNDFKIAFSEIGKYLFTSSISNLKTIETAKVIILMLAKGVLPNNFRPSDIPKNNLIHLLKPEPISDLMYNQLVKDNFYLSDSNMPDNLLLLRDNLPRKEFLILVNNSKEELEDDGRLHQLYPEVFK